MRYLINFVKYEDVKNFGDFRDQEICVEIFFVKNFSCYLYFRNGKMWMNLGSMWYNGVYDINPTNKIDITEENFNLLHKIANEIYVDIIDSLKESNTVYLAGSLESAQRSYKHYKNSNVPRADMAG